MYPSARIHKAAIVIIIRLTTWLADCLSVCLFNRPMLPAARGSRDRMPKKRKSNGYTWDVSQGKQKKNKVARRNDTAMTVKPKPRPFRATHVLLLPNRSDSISGISTVRRNAKPYRLRGTRKINPSRFICSLVTR